MVNRLAAAMNDLAATFDAAIHKAPTPRIARALCNLRAEAEDKLHRAADGYGRRWPAEIIGEALDRIANLIGGGEVMALAKRASGSGHRDDGLVDLEPQGDARTAALVAIAKEFATLAGQAERVLKRLGAVLEFGQWRHRHHETLSDMLRRGDLGGAREDMAKARQELSALLDHARVQHALDDALPAAKALIPGYHAFR